MCWIALMVINPYMLGNARLRPQHHGYWCPSAKAPGHQYPQSWLNMHCTGPDSHKGVVFIVNIIREWNNTLKTMTGHLRVKVLFKILLTHCGPERPYGITEFDHHWYRPVWCQAIACTNDNTLTNFNQANAFQRVFFRTFESGHGCAVVLLPGFAINW